MADGLLTRGLNYIDQQKQALAARLGLLANNPQEFSRQLLTETEQRMGKGLLGEPKTAQEMATGNWVNTPYGKQAIQAFSIAAPIAYHGSPYMFDKFDISKLGTGEGSQAYGHGMYFAENMPTARQFAAISSNPGFRQGTGTGTDLATLDAIIKLNARNFTDGDVNKLADIIKRKPGAFSKPDQMLERISSYVNDNPPSYLYKVDVPDAAAKTFLNWDQPISSQKQGTKALQQINKKYDFGYDNSFTGGDFYKALTTDFIRTGKATNQKEAQKLVSEELNKIGIKGIRHLDPNAKTEGLSNFVVFDPSTVKILERNNKPMQGLLK